MPENALPQPTPPKAGQPSSTPPGGTATSAIPSPGTPAATATPPAASTPSADYRYANTEDVPQWARGKTPMEVLNVAQGALTAFGRPTTGISVPATAASSPAQSPQSIDDDTLLTGKDFKRLAGELFAQHIQPTLVQNTETAAASAYAIARSNHAKEFERYGPEIATELSKVPKQYWTLDNVETVITLIKGRHRDDYAREYASQYAANVEPTIRPTGGGSGPVSVTNAPTNPFEGEHVPADWRLRAKQAGITERTIQEFCTANDMAPEDFWKQFDRSPMQPIVAEVNVRG